MCGIAGIVGRQPAESRAALDRMRDALRHRGPDDEGSWQSPSGSAALVHTRLAVIDPSPAGHQPMSTDDGRFTISFSGEIYNYRELRHDLEQCGLPFHSQSDTEVILRGYQAHGRDIIGRLRGMFALAIWDERDRHCLLARDPFGLKPLYFHHGVDGVMVFASELRALSASRLVPRDLDARGLYGYLRTGTVPEPRTLIKDVSSLEAGHTLEWKSGTISHREFWAPRFPAEPGGNHHRETVREALIDSVRHHFVSDVPVAIFLSGGVDSAAMLALTKDAGIGSVRTISMSFPGSKDDEGAAARRTAERFDARHAEVAIDAAAARDLFPQYLNAIDQPSIDGFNTFTVSRFAHEQGLKVTLSGVGADELFGGYASFTRVPQIATWHDQLAWAGPIGPLGGRILERVATGPRWRRVGDLLQQPPSIANTYSTFRAIFTRRESRVIAASLGVAAAADEGVDSEVPASTTADEVSRLELTRYVRNQLARDSDAASMACGVELRAPFLDRQLFEIVASVPAAVRLAAAKKLLRDAVPELPEWVNGPKRCFQFPFDEWAAHEWRPLFDAADADSPVPTGTWYRKLSLLVLKQWMERMKMHGC